MGENINIDQQRVHQKCKSLQKQSMVVNQHYVLEIYVDVATSTEWA